MAHGVGPRFERTRELREQLRGGFDLFARTVREYLLHDCRDRTVLARIASPTGTREPQQASAAMVDGPQPPEEFENLAERWEHARLLRARRWSSELSRVFAVLAKIDERPKK
jgi:hypothetical protein